MQNEIKQKEEKFRDENNALRIKIKYYESDHAKLKEDYKKALKNIKRSKEEEMEK